MIVGDEAAIRRATAADAVALLPLIHAHAAFERTTAAVRADALRDALSGPAPALHAWIAVIDELVGYAAATIDYATFDGDRFVSLDCLFVHPNYRRGGIGARLLAAARDHAAANGIGMLQWQTPAWNEEACRFYRRTGASAVPKMRFTLPVGNGPARDSGGRDGA